MSRFMLATTDLLRCPACGSKEFITRHDECTALDPRAEADNVQQTGFDADRYGNICLECGLVTVLTRRASVKDSMYG